MNAAVAFIDDLRRAFEEGDPGASAKHVERTNVDVLREQYRAIARGDFAAAVGLFADDVELEILGPQGHPFVGRWNGRDQVAEAMRRNFSMVADQRPEIRTLAAQGDTLVLLFRERGCFVPTGREYDVHCVQWFTIRDGKVRRVCELIDSAAAFANG
jgi:uncharacterized protein